MRDYFSGWYIKCQNDHQTIAFIPAYHSCGGIKSGSLQIIHDTGAWNVQMPWERFRMDKSEASLAECHFSKHGCVLDLREDGLRISGELKFGKLDTLAYDIMGPFRFVPFLECRHSVISMKHRVTGRLAVNGEEFLFTDGIGYMEGDRGCSFPREYLWTQCCFPEGSLMVSVADIPLGGFRFTGIVSIIRHRGREYRLATYLGARAEKIGAGEAVIRQGKLKLTVRRLEDRGKPLAAPVGGSMSRTIRESAACAGYYCLQEKERTIFEFSSDRASFEYEYPQ